MGNIIFKGVNSSTITGLLISEQPDITKPKLRQDVIEVDGRDGDIAKDLGYESYKKSALIGLHGNFDIDEVINFFDGEGWVVFANEPDKKYYGRIADSFDLERLLRFRKGKVTWVVQPFKKLIDEDTVSGATFPLVVENMGYKDALPTIIITGTAGNTYELDINEQTVASIVMPPEGTITIDSEAQECFNSNAKKNQYVTMAGDFPRLPRGENDVAVTGATNVTVIPNSRFL